MQSIQKSGLYIPNNFVAISLLSLEEVLGKNGICAVLNRASQIHLINNYPPDDLDRKFDFSDFSTILSSIEDIYGQRGSRGLELHAGRAIFLRGLKNFGAAYGIDDEKFLTLPFPERLRKGLASIALLFTLMSDEKSSVEEKEDHYEFIIHQCPQCWGRKTDAPSCFLTLGILQAFMGWASGSNEFSIRQIAAKSCGDLNCTYSILKNPGE